MLELARHRTSESTADRTSSQQLVQTCTRCILDATIPGIRFDEQGVCNHCHIHDRLNAYYPTGEKGMAYLRKMAEKIKASGRRGKFDCVVGVSGGRDSSYALYLTKELGLRPLAVHFDNGWDSDVAKYNIRKLCTGLDVELHSVIADWDESRELTNCTIRASVPYIDLTDDVGIASSLYRTADAEGIHWIIYAHSFRTEGINPLKWNYVDGRFVRSLIRRFARKPLENFRNVDMHHMLYWMFVKRIRIFTIANYFNDADPKIDELLKREFDWQDPGGWHFDNEIFGLQSYYARHKFGIDWRSVEYSALVREGVMLREEALAKIAEIPPIEREEIVAYALKKQGISTEEFAEIMAAPPKFFTDYPTYYPLLQLLRLPIKWLCRMDVLLPPHAYEKYFEV